jgi:hypothetical protein
MIFFPAPCCRGLNQTVIWPLMDRVQNTAMLRGKAEEKFVNQKSSKNPKYF